MRAALGDRALRFDLPRGIDRRALLDALRADWCVVDVVLAEEHGAVTFDFADDRARAATAVEVALRAAPDARARTDAEAHTIRVVYDGEDLDAVAEAAGVAREAIVRLHAHGDYEVSMLGFLPGFAYLRGVDARLVVPRRASPRARVPKGSVAIAAGYTAVYPLASPGGWSLLGRAVGFSAFDARGAALAVGDRVRFTPADPRELDEATKPEAAADAPRPPPGPHLVVAECQGPAIFVDGGRRRRMHEGVPPGGALVRAALARANRAAGNDARACAIELYGALTVTARGGRVTVADDGGARTLEDGEAHRVATEGRARARYLAVERGFDAPSFLGSRSALLVVEGPRALLRKGQALAIGAVHTESAGAAGEPIAEDGDAPRATIPIVPGPDVISGALEPVLRSTFRVAAAADRTGTRLDGPPLPRDPRVDRPSAPMVRGAIQLTPSGLVVLGPDHPTTGGYPAIAVVRSDGLDVLFARPPGSEVRFQV